MSHKLCRKGCRLASGAALAKAVSMSTLAGSMACSAIPPLDRNTNPTARASTERLHRRAIGTPAETARLLQCSWGSQSGV